MYFENSSKATSALEKMLEFLDARLAVSADIIGGIRAPDCVDKAGMILGSNCKAWRLTWRKITTIT